MATNRKGYLQEYYHRERTRILKEKGGVCIVCGSGHRPELHHIFSTEKFSRKQGRGMLARLTDWKRNIQNICVLCIGCHREYHFFYREINKDTLKEFCEMVRGEVIHEKIE